MNLYRISEGLEEIDTIEGRRAEQVLAEHLMGLLHEHLIREVTDVSRVEVVVDDERNNEDFATGRIIYKNDLGDFALEIIVIYAGGKDV